MAEAAAVCLEHLGHPETVQLHVRNNDEVYVELIRQAVTNDTRIAYADLERATELGACGVALLLIGPICGFTAIRPSRKGTGFDYWLGPNTTPPGLPFQDCARLEVSGILDGDDAKFKSRLAQKLKQPTRSDSTGLPAFAVVVEFSVPQTEVRKR